MRENQNELGQPIGFPVEDWQTCKRPSGSPMQGKYCRIEPYDPGLHNQALFEAFIRDENHTNWTYLPYGPFSDFESFDQWARQTCQQQDPLFHTIFDLKTDKAVGIASYLRISPEAGVIEVGHIHFSPLLQRTVLSSECMYLMMKRVFDELGYRRYEWKCDSLNAPSCSAANRLGFTFEGIFRQATMYKGRNRDTAWYAITDKDWPAIKQAFEQWLDANNFDADGQQKNSLGSYMPDH